MLPIATPWAVCVPQCLAVATPCCHALCLGSAKPWVVCTCHPAWLPCLVHGQCHAVGRLHAPPCLAVGTPCAWAVPRSGQLACHTHPLPYARLATTAWAHAPPPMSRASPCLVVGSHGLSGATPWAHAPHPCLVDGSPCLVDGKCHAVGVCLMPCRGQFACHTMHWAVSQARIAAIPPCCHGMGCGACELSYPYSLASNGLATMTWRVYAIIAIPCPWALGTPTNPSMPQNSDNQILAIAWDMHRAVGIAWPSVPQHSVTYRTRRSHRPTPRGVSHHFPSRRTAVHPVPERTSGVLRGQVIEWDLGGGTNRSDAGLNLSGSWQQGHSATYNTPSRI